MSDSTDRPPVAADVLAEWVEAFTGVELDPLQRRALAAPRHLDVAELHAQQRAERARQRERIAQLDAYLDARDGVSGARRPGPPVFSRRTGAEPSYVVFDEAAAWWPDGPAVIAGDRAIRQHRRELRDRPTPEA